MTGTSLPRSPDFPKRLFHQSLLKGILFAPNIVLGNLLYITGDGNYSQLVMVNGQKHLCSRAVSFYEEHLAQCSDAFLRVHKQCIINTRHVKKYATNRIIMIDGHAVPIARRRKKIVKEKMSALSKGIHNGI